MIEIRKLHVAFGENCILEDIDLEIPEQDILIIVGESGCGKSVLMKTIEGLYYPQSGSVKIDGLDIHKVGRKQRMILRKKMAMLFQGSALLDSLTVYQNVALPLREHADISDHKMLEIVTENLRKVGLHEILDKMPSQLSGGMKKRVALARAMVLKPQYIIFDEPTTGLDPVTSAEIISLIKTLFKDFKITPIIVTHDFKLINNITGRIVMIHDKKKIFDGNYNNFRISNDKRIKRFIGIK